MFCGGFSKAGTASFTGIIRKEVLHSEDSKKMEVALSSDDSCDSEMRNMKTQLSEFGLDEDNLSKEEMIDLLKALNNSKSTVKEHQLLHEKDDKEDLPVSSPSKRTLKRRYLDVADRRMPWSLLPKALTQVERACTLAVYIKLMSINTYGQARLSPNLALWPPGIQIVEETTRNQPHRSTRSGRSAPVYAGFEDDPNDLDFVVTKPKKRKTSSSEQNSSEGTGPNKFLSLKRKTTKDVDFRPSKEAKLIDETEKPKSRTDIIFSLVED